MRPFRSTESDIFYGQEDHVEAVLERLSRSRLVAVLGESGCGKSSLVRAGVVPELAGTDQTWLSALWTIIVTEPKGLPIQNLAESVAAALKLTGQEAEAGIRAHTHGLVDLIRRELGADRQILLIVDQFEELFAFRRESNPINRTRLLGEAVFFVNTLLHASRSADANIYVMLTMRSEYIGDCALLPGLAEAINECAFLLPKMTRFQCEQAILKPLEMVGCEIDHALLQRLLQEAATCDQDGLPLLQYTLRRLWESWKSKGAEGAISFGNLEYKSKAFELTQKSRAEWLDKGPPGDLHVLTSQLNDGLESIWDELGVRRKIAICLFKLLGEYNHQGREIRVVADRKKASKLSGANQAEVDQTISKFSSEKSGIYFLKTSGDDVQVSHEVLLRRWVRVQDYLTQEAKAGWLLKELNRRAGRKKRAKLSGLDLKEAKQLVAQNKPFELWATRYVDVAEQARVKTFVRSSRNVNRIRRGILALVLLLAAGAIVDVSLLDYLLGKSEPDPIKRLVNARVAWGLWPAPVKRLERALWDAYQIPSPDSWIKANPAEGDPRIVAIAADPGSHKVAFAYQNTVAIWDDKGAPLPVPAPTCPSETCQTFTIREEIKSLSYGRVDGEGVLAIGGAQGITILYPGRDKQKNQDWFQVFSKGTWGISFSSDGQQILATGSNGSGANGARLYDTKSHSLQEFGGAEHGGDVSAATFGPNQMLYTVGRDGSLISWKLTSGKPERSGQHDVPIGPLTDIAYNGRGLLAVCGSGRSVALLDAYTGQLLKTISSPSEPVRPIHRVVFSRNGLLLAMATAEAVRVVDIGRTATLLPLSSLHGDLTSLAFEANDRLATATSLGAVEVFPMATGAPDSVITIGPKVANVSVNATAVSLSGRWLATVYDGDAGDPKHLRHSGNLELRDISGKGAPLESLDVPVSADVQGDPMHSIVPASLYSVAFFPESAASKDTPLIATGDSSGKIAIWRNEGGELKEIESIASGHDVVFGLAVSPDGKWLASGSHDGVLRLWTMNGGHHTGEPREWVFDPKLKILTRDNHIIRGVQFSPDSQFLASARSDGTVRIIDIGANISCDLTGHQSAVRAISFHPSPMVRRLVSGAEDGIVRLWNYGTCTNNTLGEIKAYSDSVQGVGYANAEKMWAISKNGHVTAFNIDESGLPKKDEVYELIAADPFKLSTSRDRVVVSTSGHQIYLYPTTANGLANLIDKQFSADRIANHEFLTHPATGSQFLLASDTAAYNKLKKIKAQIALASKCPGTAKSILAELSVIARENRNFDIDANVWNDLCYFGSAGENPVQFGVDVMPACWAAVTTNPSDANIRATVAFALGRRQQWPEATTFAIGALESPQFVASKVLFQELERMRKGEKAFQSPELLRFLQDQRQPMGACPSIPK